MTTPDHNNDDLLDRVIEAFRNEPVPEGPPSDLAAETVELLSSAGPRWTTNPPQQRRARMLRIARNTGLGAAAVILVTLLGWLVAINTTSSIAFGDVIENVKKAKSVTLVNKQKIGNQPELQFQWSLQGDSIRMEIPEQMTMIGNLKQKKALQLNHVAKVAYQILLEDGTQEAFANPLDQIRNIKPKDARQQGEEEINGQKAIVYLVEKIDFFGIKSRGEMRIWVDPKSELPVKIHIGVNTRHGSSPDDRPFDTVMTLEQFEWNKPLDPKLFSLEIPEGYEVRQGPPGPHADR
jgi:outer membrane lipoprotein-sorting protein